MDDSRASSSAAGATLGAGTEAERDGDSGLFGMDDDLSVLMRQFIQDSSSSQQSAQPQQQLSPAVMTSTGAPWHYTQAAFPASGSGAYPAKAAAAGPCNPNPRSGLSVDTSAMASRTAAAAGHDGDGDATMSLITSFSPNATSAPIALGSMSRTYSAEKLDSGTVPPHMLDYLNFDAGLEDPLGISPAPTPSYAGSLESSSWWGGDHRTDTTDDEGVDEAGEDAAEGSRDPNARRKRRRKSLSRHPRSSSSFASSLASSQQAPPAMQTTLGFGGPQQQQPMGLTPQMLNYRDAAESLYGGGSSSSAYASSVGSASSNHGSPAVRPVELAGGVDDLVAGQQHAAMFASLDLQAATASPAPSAQGLQRQDQQRDSASPMYLPDALSPQPSELLRRQQQAGVSSATLPLRPASTTSDHSGAGQAPTSALSSSPQQQPGAGPGRSGSPALAPLSIPPSIQSVTADGQTVVPGHIGAQGDAPAFNVIEATPATARPEGSRDAEIQRFIARLGEEHDPSTPLAQRPPGQQHFPGSVAGVGGPQQQPFVLVPHHLVPPLLYPAATGTPSTSSVQLLPHAVQHPIASSGAPPTANSASSTAPAHASAATGAATVDSTPFHPSLAHHYQPSSSPQPLQPEHHQQQRRRALSDAPLHHQPSTTTMHSPPQHTPSPQPGVGGVMSSAHASVTGAPHSHPHAVYYPVYASGPPTSWSVDPTSIYGHPYMAAFPPSAMFHSPPPHLDPHQQRELLAGRAPSSRQVSHAATAAAQPYAFYSGSQQHLASGATTTRHRRAHSHDATSRSSHQSSSNARLVDDILAGAAARGSLQYNSYRPHTPGDAQHGLVKPTLGTKGALRDDSQSPVPHAMLGTANGGAGHPTSGPDGAAMFVSTSSTPEPGYDAHDPRNAAAAAAAAAARHSPGAELAFGPQVVHHHQHEHHQPHHHPQLQYQQGLQPGKMSASVSPSPTPEDIAAAARFQSVSPAPSSLFPEEEHPLAGMPLTLQPRGTPQYIVKEEHEALARQHPHLVGGSILPPGTNMAAAAAAAAAAGDELVEVTDENGEILIVRAASRTTPATIEAAHRRRNPNSEAKFICDLCGEGFTRRYNLRGHQRAHRGEKPYACSFEGCDKAFARAHDCKRHEALHLGIRRPRTAARGRSSRTPAAGVEADEE